MTKQVRCNQCEALMINGVFCHETGCPNAKRKRECFYCGYEDCDGECTRWDEDEMEDEDEIDSVCAS